MPERADLLMNLSACAADAGFGYCPTLASVLAPSPRPVLQSRSATELALNPGNHGSNRAERVLSDAQLPEHLWNYMARLAIARHCPGGLAAGSGINRRTGGGGLRSAKNRHLAGGAEGRLEYPGA